MRAWWFSVLQIRRWHRLWLGLAALCLFILVSGGFAVHRLTTLETQNSDTVMLRIDPGRGTAQIARDMVFAGLVEQSLAIRLLAFLRGDSGRLQWGEYRVPPHLSVTVLLDKLRRGERYQRRLAVPEGLSGTQILTLLNAADGLAGPPLTGDEIAAGLLPETYFYEWRTPRKTLLAQMRAKFEMLLNQLWQTRQFDLPLESPEEAVILASMIEKETGTAGERALIAAVFHNRLRAGIRLQSDPTVIYALTGGLPLGRALRRTDLKVDSPYNTYQVKGLPPAPIAYPGRAALEAALQPAASDYLYFVADGKGGHRFARTLSEHNRNVRAYRRTRDQVAGDKSAKQGVS